MRNQPRRLATLVRCARNAVAQWCAMHATRIKCAPAVLARVTRPATRADGTCKEEKNIKGIPKDSKEATKIFVGSEDSKKLLSYLRSEDPLGFVVRGHLFIEARLTSLIEMALSKPAALKLVKKTFALKVELAVATGSIDESIGKALLQLNRLRNKFGHDVQYQLSSADCRAIFDVLPRGLQKKCSEGGDLLTPTEFKTGTEDTRHALGLTRAVIVALFAYLAAILDARRHAAALRTSPTSPSQT